MRGRSTSVSELVRLEPTAYTAGRTGNILGAAVTGGISKAKLKAVVRGSRAAVQVPEATEFYFVFDKTDQGMGPSFAWLSQITSPNEFSLIRFDVKTNSREVVVGAVGAYSRQSGTEDQAIIQFTLTRLAPGKYRVVPDGSIPIGQYAFITESGPSYGVAGNRVFDFGVTGRSTR
ncbi:MAG: hypothetical protein KF785_05775 [Gemmatimonadales bacterium]|nr:hypothetical protein [Gemmatimonadales bacterium]